MIMTHDTTERRVPVALLRGLGVDILMASGLDHHLASIVAASLVTADARSIASHGMVRLLPEYVRRIEQGSTNPTPNIQVVSRDESVALLDADGAPGQVAGTTAIQMAVDMARERGLAAVGVRNSSHFGMGALYVEQVAAEGMIGIAMTNATPNMPPAGGRGRFLGTNPIAIGIPRVNEDPIVLDMSTSVVARGKIVMAEKEGRPIPDGWAIDKDGNPTADPSEALAGAVLPMAGYKGAGLALIIDIFSGVLTGAAFGAHVVDLYDTGPSYQNVGHFFLAIQVGALMPLDTFHARLEDYVEELRAQPRQPGVDRIYLPGELEFAAARHAEAEGIPVSPEGWAELHELAQRFGVGPLDHRLQMAEMARSGSPPST